MPRKAKKKSASRPDAMSAAQLRREAARLDRELLKVLQQRGDLQERLAEQDQGKSSYDPAADAAWLEEMVGRYQGPLPRSTIRAVCGQLLSGLRSLRRPLRVAYLGPEYSYSHLAALERFGESAELLPVATVSAVFEELDRGHADFGLAPLENSTDGRVADTLSMFARCPLRICGEVNVPIHHHLLAACPRNRVREVYSKPQALSQCRDWLATHLPSARLVDVASTAAAAQVAASKEGAAAVASRQAAARYNLPVIAEKIEDNPNNVTRFAVIGAQAPAPSGRDKTSLMFEVRHRPGALAEAMAIFKRNELNLTWIESFPIPGERNKYLFFVELEGHESEPAVARAIKSLRGKAVRLDVLGSYPCSPGQ